MGNIWLFWGTHLNWLSSAPHRLFLSSSLRFCLKLLVVLSANVERWFVMIFFIRAFIVLPFSGKCSHRVEVLRSHFSLRVPQNERNARDEATSLLSALSSCLYHSLGPNLASRWSRRRIRHCCSNNAIFTYTFHDVQ